MARAPWELPPPSWEESDRWSDLSEGEGMDVTAEEAGERLADYLLHLNDLGKMSAKVLCIVA